MNIETPSREQILKANIRNLEGHIAAAEEERSKYPDPFDIKSMVIGHSIFTWRRLISDAEAELKGIV